MHQIERYTGRPPAPVFDRGCQPPADRLSPNDLVFVLAAPPLAMLFGLGCLFDNQAARGWSMLAAGFILTLSHVAIIGGWVAVLRHHADDQRREDAAAISSANRLLGKEPVR